MAAQILLNIYTTWVIAAKSTKRAMARKRVYFLLVICLLPVLAVGAWRIFAPIASYKYHGPNGYQMYEATAFTSFLQFLVPLVPLFLGTAAINDEIEEKTIMFLFLRPVPKFIVVLAKTLSVMLSSAVILGGTLAFVFAICASAPNAAMIPGDLPVLLKDIGVFALASFAYGGLFLLFGVIFRKPHVWGLIFIFAWDSYAAYLPGNAGIMNIKHFVTSIYPHQAYNESPLAMLAYHEPVSTATGITVLVCVGVACSFLAFLAFQARDYGYEKAAV